MMFSKVKFVAMLVGLLAFVFGANSAHALDSVRLQLKWQHQFQFAGYYAALEQGYYRDAGLDVTIIEAKEDQKPINSVLSGDAEFGVGTSDLLLFRQRGEPVVVLAVIFQHSPLGLLVRKDSAIRNVHELSDRRVMIEAHSAELLAYFKREQLDINKLELIEHTFDTQALTDGKVDAMSIYTTDEPFALKEQDIPYLLFEPLSAGIDFYGDNLFTTENQIEEHPERVKAFRSASIKGWEYAMAHPEEVIQLIYQKYSQRHSMAHLRFEAQETARLLQPRLVELGYINPGRWQHIVDSYIEGGMLTKDFSLDGFIYQSEPLKLPLWIYWLISIGLFGILTISAVSLHIHRLNIQLQSNEMRYRGIYDNAPSAYIVWDNNYLIREWNQQAQRIFGWSRKEAVGQNLLNMLFPELSQAVVKAVISNAIENRQPINSVNTHLSKEGRHITCEWIHDNLMDHKGRRIGAVSMAADITERSKLENTLNKQAVAVESAGDAVVITDTQGNIEYVNPAFCQMTGYGQEESIGLNTRVFNSGLLNNDFYNDLWETIKKGEIWRGEMVNKRKDGSHYTEETTISPVINDQGEIFSFVAIKRDCSEVSALRSQLQHLALYDPLTNLPNRKLLWERLQQALSVAERTEEKFGLLFVDLDGFKALNDTFGHKAGDQCLTQVGERLSKVLRSSDTVARLGGDEFVLLLRNVHQSEYAAQVAGKILVSFEQPFLFEQSYYHISASIGIALYPEHSRTAEGLLHCSDKAMYSVKRANKNSFTFFEQPLNS